MSPHWEKNHDQKTCNQMHMYKDQQFKYLADTTQECALWERLQLWANESQTNFLGLDHTGMFIVLLPLMSPVFIVNMLFLANRELHFCIHLCVFTWQWQSSVSVVPSVLHSNDKDHSYYCVSANFKCFSIFSWPFYVPERRKYMLVSQPSQTCETDLSLTRAIYVKRIFSVQPSRYKQK